MGTSADWFLPIVTFPFQVVLEEITHAFGFSLRQLALGGLGNGLS
jgi:hypothetical protein